MVPEAGPLTRPEEAMWLLQHSAPDPAVCNLSVAVHLDQPLDHHRLKASLIELTARHPPLRSRFPHTDGNPTREIVSEAAIAAAVERADLPEGSDAWPALVDTARRGFDLEHGPLVRLTYYQADNGAAVLQMTVHHLVADGPSLQTILTDLGRAYAGEALATAPGIRLPRQAPGSAESRRYWIDSLAGLPPTRRSLSPVPTSRRTSTAAGHVIHHLSGEAQDALRGLRRSLRLSDNIALLGAVSIALGRHGLGEDFVLGVPVSRRASQLADAVGFSISLLPVRVRPERRLAVGQFMRQVRDDFLEGLAHADVSLEELPELPRVSDSAWDNGVTHHLFNFIPYSRGVSEFAGMPVRTQLVATGATPYELELWYSSAEAGPTISATYARELLEERAVRALLARIEKVLAVASGSPETLVGELDMWTEADRQVVAAANATRRAWPAGSSILEDIERSARANPDGPAVDAEGEGWSYRRLWRAAEGIARRLAEHGIGTGDVVGVELGRGPWAAAAVLGVWLAGGAYLPLEPEAPDRRRRHQLQDAAARVVLHMDRPDGALGEDPKRVDVRAAADATKPETLAASRPEPGDVAYVIYTSGSTGQPKGTVVPHRSLRNIVLHMAEATAFGPGHRAVWLTTIGFDISALEWMLPLARGGTVVVAPSRVLSDPGWLEARLADPDLRFVQATPTAWRLLEPALQGRDLRRQCLVSGGEELTPALAGRLLATGARVLNAYGPTETTIWSTVAELQGDAPAGRSIGRPISNTTVHITDPEGHPQPPGVVGELCIAGDGLALGYLNRPMATADRFVDLPVIGRVYRTGDVAFWTFDGELAFLGRRDRQIKLRGHRIELGEVEAALERHPEVAAAAVAATHLGDPDRAGLVAFLIPSAMPDPARTGLRDRLWAFLRDHLPPAWLPHELVVRDAFPRNSSGKVDHSRLAQDATAIAARGNVDGPDDTRDQAVEAGGATASLIELWEELLGREGVTARTDFFRSGGNSMLAARLCARIHRRLGAQVTLNDVFTWPTPAELASTLKEMPP